MGVERIWGQGDKSLGSNRTTQLRKIKIITTIYQLVIRMLLKLKNDFICLFSYQLKNKQINSFVLFTSAISTSLLSFDKRWSRKIAQLIAQVNLRSPCSRFLTEKKVGTYSDTLPFYTAQLHYIICGANSGFNKNPEKYS